MIDIDLIWRKYATTAGIIDQRPDFRFDPKFYGSYHPQHKDDIKFLKCHYDQEGKAGGLKANLYDYLSAASSDINPRLTKLVTDADLAAAIEQGAPGSLELACELIYLGEPVDMAMSNFSMSAYLLAYPDIAKAGVNPLLHYLLHGAAEGRQTLADLRQSQYAGDVAYSPDRPTCIIAVHEFSRTGAPIVGLDLAREASQTHNVIVVSLLNGPLLDEFRKHASEVVVTNRPLIDFTFYSGEIFSKIDFAITNSVECYPMFPLLVSKNIPFVSYIHEYTEYTYPLYKTVYTALFADMIVFSSDHVRQSWHGVLRDVGFDKDRDSTIIPQRECVMGAVDGPGFLEARERLSERVGRDLSNVRLVCGAGHLQWRKGTDIFAMAAQICAQRDPNTVFIWIGDGLNAEDVNFGTWINYHLRQLGAGDPENNFFLLPAGTLYPDVLKASDAMFVSSRLDPLPNVVFDALDSGCRIVQFANATGFGDQRYLDTGYFTSVEYGNPEAAATAILALPRKMPTAEKTGRVSAPPRLFDRISAVLDERLKAQRYFVRGASEIDVPMLFSREAEDRDLRTREREKTIRYSRRLLWRDIREVREELARSDNWIHRKCRIAPYRTVAQSDVPAFSMHIHAYYTDEIADDLKKYRAYHLAQRIVVTTDSQKKGDEITQMMEAEGLKAEIVLVPNKGRDILPFMDLFREGGAAGDDEIWCHIHQKKSLGTTDKGDIWRRFLLRILLGDDKTLSGAIAKIGDEDVGLVAPLDPFFIPWNASRNLLPKFASRLPGPMPENPLVFPIGNMFWVRRPVVLAMNAVFGDTYSWPNEPIANDGTEFHLIERLWPAMSTHCDLNSVFVHKLDEQRA